MADIARRPPRGTRGYETDKVAGESRDGAFLSAANADDKRCFEQASMESGRDRTPAGAGDSGRSIESNGGNPIPATSRLPAGR